MRIATTADIHAPLYLELFERSMNEFLERGLKTDIFLIAGDMIDRGRMGQLDKVCSLLERVNEPIFACFGNNEYFGQEEEIVRKCPKIKFLDDEYITLNMNRERAGIVGSRGSLDEPTFWQRRNVPNIREVYKNRIMKLRDISRKLDVDYKILLIHYPPTYKILEGESPRFFPQMGSKRLESLIKEFDLVITGHAHRGRRSVSVDGIPVVNVALPLHKRIVFLELKPRHGLERFL